MLSALHILIHLVFEQLCEVGTLIISIFKWVKLRHRQIKFAQCDKAS